MLICKTFIIIPTHVHIHTHTHTQGGLAGLTLRPGMLDKVLRHVLIEKREGVEIYAQSGGRNGPWAVSKRASSGNVGEVEGFMKEGAFGHGPKVGKSVCVCVCILVCVCIYEFL
jgi:hypothetical protein